MDYFKHIIFYVITLMVLFLLSSEADDMRFGIAEIHESMGNRDSAVESYERVLSDFTNKKTAAEAALVRLNPDSPWVSHLKKKKRK